MTASSGQPSLTEDEAHTLRTLWTATILGAKGSTEIRDSQRLVDLGFIEFGPDGTLQVTAAGKAALRSLTNPTK